MSDSTRIIDLSMEVHSNMNTYPGVIKPEFKTVASHEQFAKDMGVDKFGILSTCAHCQITIGDHIGTHIDAWWHGNPEGSTAEAIPLEYCYGDGVILDFTDKKPGYFIEVKDLKNALDKIQYSIKERDIVLIRTDSSIYQDEPRYLEQYPGMGKEATRWLFKKGVKLIGIDANGFDVPIWKMFESKRFWESHLLMREFEYYHIENLSNLDKIPIPYGFKFAAFPIFWRGTSAAPVRAVAIL